MRDERARHGRVTLSLGVRVIEVAGDAEQVVLNAGRAVRRTDLAQNHFYFVASPVDAALLLRHQPACLPANVRLRQRDGPECVRGEALNGQ